MPGIEELRQKGVRSWHYIPNNAILASVPVGFNPAALQNLRWMGRLLPEDKLSAVAAEQMRAHPSQSYTFTVETFGEAANLRRSLPTPAELRASIRTILLTFKS